MRQAILAMALTGAWALAAHAAGKPASLVGSMAPDFTSRDAVTRQRIRLSEQQGKVVVLTFWATWCHPCREEVPILENLQKVVGKDRLVVYAVPFQEPERAYDELVKIFRDWQITLIDDRHDWIAGRYRINAIPHLFIIGRDGRITAEHLGYGQGSLQGLVDDVNAALRPVAAGPTSAAADQPPQGTAGEAAPATPESSPADPPPH
jgi:thiol-disulfide isomerase/thioredoxin